MHGATDTEKRLVRSFLERLNAFLAPDPATLHEDVVLVAVDAAGGRRAHYHGVHGIREWLGDPAARAWAEVHVHADEWVSGPSRLTVLGRIGRHGREDPFALVFEFSGGRISRIEAYPSHEEALGVRP